jgi:hypothetical protein
MTWVCLGDRTAPSVDLILFPSDVDGKSVDSRNRIMDLLLPLTFAVFWVRPFFVTSSLLQPIVPPLSST